MKPPGQVALPPRPKHSPDTRKDARPPGSNPSTVRRPAVMQEPVLVLNATFEPINVTAVRRAMVLMLKGAAQAEEISHTQVIRLPVRSRCRRLFACWRTGTSRNRPGRSRGRTSFSGPQHLPVLPTHSPASELTLDHVMPRSRGGRSSWENLVACCYQCNNRKGDRHTPRKPGWPWRVG